LIALPVPNARAAGSTSRLQVKLHESIGAWAPYLEALIADCRASRASVGGQVYWVASERSKVFAQIFPTARFEQTIPDVGEAAASGEEALFAMVTGWMAHSGPVTARQLVDVLGDVLGVGASEIDKALLRLEATGSVLRGKFTDPAAGETEWCDRRLLARIHRWTLGALRKQVEPVNAAQFMRWVLRWQHLVPGTQVLGERGMLEVLQQLQGFEAPANSWERQILARRVADYDPKILDQLSLTGAVGWGRLSPHPATLDTVTPERRRVAPISVAPITFFVREDADWMIPRRETGEEETRGLSLPAIAVLQFLRQRGASFFADIVRATGKLKSEVEMALWELVAAGLLTADGFDNLRALIDPKRRAGQGSGRSARPRHSAGRWSLLYPAEAPDRNRALEAICWMLLRRYGIVFREVLARETILPKWREILIALRRLEDRGEIRGGRFVGGFLGEQFALPVAVESLRAQRNLGHSGEIITVSAGDPLNLVGIIVPGERVSSNSGKLVAFRDGVAVPPDIRGGVVMMAATR
jgi:ATP-dependent Lhr-like helicase